MRKGYSPHGLVLVSAEDSSFATNNITHVIAYITQIRLQKVTPIITILGSVVVCLLHAVIGDLMITGKTSALHQDKTAQSLVLSIFLTC